MQEFTETFEEFLNNKSGNWLVNKLADIPSFKFKDEELNIDYTLLFSNLIKNKYLLREIGAETEEMFEYYFDRKIDEIKIKYVPKVSMWINNFNDLFKFTVRLNLEKNYSSGDINTNLIFLYLDIAVTSECTVLIVFDTLSPLAVELELADENPITLPPSSIIAASKLSLVLVLGSKNKVANFLPSHL